LVVTFGLFHGLVTLPVLLSLLGPNSTTLESPSNSEAAAEEADQDETDPEQTRLGGGGRGHKYALPPTSDSDAKDRSNGHLPGGIEYN
jgi:hypothetical protein